MIFAATYSKTIPSLVNVTKGATSYHISVVNAVFCIPWVYTWILFSHDFEIKSWNYYGDTQLYVKWKSQPRYIGIVPLVCCHKTSVDIIDAPVELSGSRNRMRRIESRLFVYS